MKNFTFLFLAMMLSGNIFAQTLLAKWTFPTGTATDSLADGGITVNLSRAINTGGGVSAIDFSTNGYTTKAAKATQWDNGMDTKYWIIDVSTVGYDSITLSSKQQSGGSYPGPRDFKVQYKSGGSGTWTDVPGTTLVLDNNWSAILDNVPLPSDCNNKNHIYLRWIMTSNTSSGGGTILPTGISKIDDIFVNGKIITGINERYAVKDIHIFPIPAKDKLNISAGENIISVSVYDVIGKKVIEVKPDNCSISINLMNLKKGLYFVQIYVKNCNKPYMRKFTVE